MARHFRGSGHILRFIEYMDVGHTNGWRMDDVVPSAEIVARIDASCRSSRSIPTTRRSRRALALPRRQRRDRRHLLGHAGLLPRLHARAARRPTASSTPACSPPTAHDLRALLRGGATDDEIGSHRRGDLARRADRYSEIRSENTRALPKVEMSYIGG